MRGVSADVIYIKKLCATLLCEWALLMEREEVGLKGQGNLRCGALYVLKLAFVDKTIVIVSGSRLHIKDK